VPLTLRQIWTHELVITRSYLPLSFFLVTPKPHAEGKSSDSFQPHVLHGIPVAGLHTVEYHAPGRMWEQYRYQWRPRLTAT
jgi:hypothetical protein